MRTGAIGSFRASRGSFTGWLYRLTRNLAIDSRRRTRPFLPLARLGPFEPTDGWTPERDLLRRERQSKLVA